MPSGPLTVFCVYKFKPSTSDAAIHDLLRRHRASLVRASLTTARSPYVMRSLADHRIFVEVFDWANEAAAGKAHQDALVQTVWSEFNTLCESVGLPFNKLPESQTPWGHFAAWNVNYDGATKAKLAPVKAAAAKPAPIKATPAPATAPAPKAAASTPAPSKTVAPKTTPSKAAATKAPAPAPTKVSAKSKASAKPAPKAAPKPIAKSTSKAKPAPKPAAKAPAKARPKAKASR